MDSFFEREDDGLQNLQCRLKKIHDAVRARVDRILHEMVQDKHVDPADFPLQLESGALLLNDPDSPPRRRQAWHMDVPASSHSLSVIVPLATVQLDYANGSHRILRSAARLVRHAEGDSIPFLPMNDRPSRRTFDHGDVIVFHGNLIHAGAPGIRHQASPRFHWYVGKHNKKRTYVLSKEWLINNWGCDESVADCIMSRFPFIKAASRVV